MSNLTTVPFDPREQAVDDGGRMAGLAILHSLIGLFGHAQLHRWIVNLSAEAGVVVCTEQGRPHEDRT